MGLHSQASSRTTSESTGGTPRPGPAVFRDLNDDLARLSSTAATSVRLFVCECAQPACAESLEAPIFTYRATRAAPDRYLVAPGHELNGGGVRVVERTPRYSIVEQATPWSSAPAGTSGDAADRPSPRVLIVDDDPTVRSLVGVNLQFVGLATIEASNGLEGADRARVTQPDLVVTDVNMPGLDGFELAEALRRDERTRTIPIIFISGQTEGATVERAHSLGALAFVVKPFDPVALANRVRELFALPVQAAEG